MEFPGKYFGQKNHGKLANTSFLARGKVSKEIYGSDSELEESWFRFRKERCLQDLPCFKHAENEQSDT